MKDWIKDAYVEIVGKDRDPKWLHVFMLTTASPTHDFMSEVHFKCRGLHGPDDCYGTPLQEWIDK